jgi:hypothetical protein
VLTEIPLWRHQNTEVGSTSSSSSSHMSLYIEWSLCNGHLSKQFIVIIWFLQQHLKHKFSFLLNILGNKGTELWSDLPMPHSSWAVSLVFSSSI